VFDQPHNVGGIIRSKPAVLPVIGRSDKQVCNSSAGVATDMSDQVVAADALVESYQSPKEAAVAQLGLAKNDRELAPLQPH